jgi:hypothetical protein
VKGITLATSTAYDTPASRYVANVQFQRAYALPDSIWHKTKDTKMVPHAGSDLLDALADRLATQVIEGTVLSKHREAIENTQFARPDPLNDTPVGAPHRTLCSPLTHACGKKP